MDAEASFDLTVNLHFAGTQVDQPGYSADSAANLPARALTVRPTLARTDLGDSLRRIYHPENGHLIGRPRDGVVKLVFKATDAIRRRIDCERVHRCAVGALHGFKPRAVNRWFVELTDVGLQNRFETGRHDLSWLDLAVVPKPTVLVVRYLAAHSGQ